MRKAENVKSFESLLRNLFNLKEKLLLAIHVNEPKFHHNFKHALSPVRDCCSETEATNHFFLHCPFFTINRQNPINNLFKIFL